MEAEVTEMINRNLWHRVFMEIREESMNHSFTTSAASKSENKCLNRYRDVLPYDHSRVVLRSHPATDYINASLVKVPRASRSYVLAQGPLSSTMGHFWLNVWQQRSRAVLMLNRVIEKGQLKCHQYWPEFPGESFDLEDVGLQLDHVTSDPGEHYTLRTLRLSCPGTGESREILHFHYTTWPDFGVPKCPDTFLEFLSAVRRSGSLEPDVGPAVVHCSAGIGRSGTFCLVDSCLVLAGKEGPESVKIRDILLEMRRYRMGLIQTPDQLKFSYLAIAVGACQSGLLPNDNSLMELCRTEQAPNSENRRQAESSSDSSDDDDLRPPPLPPPRTESLKASDAFRQLLEVGMDTHLISPAVAPQNNGGAGEAETLAIPSDRATGQPVSAGAILAGGTGVDLGNHKNLRATMSEGASTTKCILNNHKLEERKKEMEMRRRKKEEKKNAMEQHLRETKKKMKESEDWSRRKQSLMEKAVPFCLGLSMLVVGGLYFYTKA